MIHINHRRSMAAAKHARRRGWPFFAALFLIALAIPELALAHGALRRAQPASGAHLGTVPREIRLTFNENVELAVARIQLTGPDSARIRLGTLALAPDSARVLVAPIGGALQAGEYTVAWQIAGADGHPVRGTYSFVIAPGAEGLAPPPTQEPGTQTAPPADPDETHHNAATFPSGPGFDAESPLYVAVRWLTYVGLLGVLGALALRLVVLPAAGRLGAGTIAAPAAARAAGIGVAAAALVAVAAVLRLYAQSYAMHGPAADAGLVTAMLARTTWGWGWIMQAVGAVVALAGFAAARRSGAGWPLAAVGGLALAVAPALSGHASAVPRLSGLAIVADAVHVLGAGGWVGGLFLLVAAGVPAAMRLPKEERGPAVASLVKAFSPVALVCAGALTLTGLFATWLHVGSPPALWQTDYGRTLLVKLALLSVVFGTGAYNWLRLRPALGDEVGATRLRRSAAVEIAAGVLVLLATAVLVATAAPAGS